jgi:hypothetical protein
LRSDASTIALISGSRSVLAVSPAFKASSVLPVSYSLEIFAIAASRAEI